MNARFKELRRELKLTQEEFANKMNLSRSYINLIEMGKKVPADRTIKDICREFGVREEWLRDGTGEMFIPKSKDEEISELLADIQKSAFLPPVCFTSPGSSSHFHFLSKPCFAFPFQHVAVDRSSFALHLLASPSHRCANHTHFTASLFRL